MLSNTYTIQSKNTNVNGQMNTSNEEKTSLRQQLLKLFAEQKNWQKQLQEVGGNMTFDDVRNQINQAQNKINRHQEIIVKCQECEKKHGEKVRLCVPNDEEWDREYVIFPVVKDYWDDRYPFYDIEHSQKRISFWDDEIAQCEQKLQMMEIAQEQLEQVTQDIADINEQIKNATTRSGKNISLEEEPTNKIDNESIQRNNKESKVLYRLDLLSLDICQRKFKDIVITAKTKQGVLREIRKNTGHFNPNCFSHKELANKLNNLQDRFEFTPTDVDKAYQEKK